jgi:hypothetical protein
VPVMFSQSGVAVEVRGLERVAWRRSCKRADGSVLFDQVLPEFALPQPHTNTRLNMASGQRISALQRSQCVTATDQIKRAYEEIPMRPPQTQL